MIFFPQDNSTQLSILEYLLFQMGVVDGISSIWTFCQISSCEILGSQKTTFFSRFLAVFLQINPKSKVTTMSSRRPQGPLTGIVQFDCNTFANTTKFGNSSPDYIWQILQVNLVQEQPVAIAPASIWNGSGRPLNRQLLFEKNVEYLLS